MKTTFTKNAENNGILIKRTFEAPLELTWKAWTTSEILDLWWAPKPYRVKTKFMDFSEGGHWLYAMISPEDEKHWCKGDYLKISLLKSYEALDAFCDEEGKINTDFPRTHWKINFSEIGNNTAVEIKVSYNSVADMEKILEMGFKEGFSMALENLDEYVKQQFKLRSEQRTDNLPRVVTYLNFPGNTEEAFIFYKSVFGTEFSGKGIQRLGDVPPIEGKPPIAENLKKLILHIELPILGGHVLVATDAPKEMGFDLKLGDNMHICLEPESREETHRLFNRISKDGNITMPLEDMFFGAYFGMCTDKFGINWMFNFNNPKD